MPERILSPRDGAPKDGAPTWELRLFVAGSDLEVERVQAALEKVCKEHVPGRYVIAMVDILLDPEKADAFDIVAAPTLIRESPLPVKRIIGDLSQVRKVLLGLGLPVPQEP